VGVALAVFRSDDKHTPSGNSGNSASGRLPERAETSAPHQTRVAYPGLLGPVFLNGEKGCVCVCVCVCVTGTRTNSIPGGNRSLG